MSINKYKISIGKIGIISLELVGNFAFELKWMDFLIDFTNSRMNRVKLFKNSVVFQMRVNFHQIKA